MHGLGSLLITECVIESYVFVIKNQEWAATLMGGEADWDIPHTRDARNGAPIQDKDMYVIQLLGKFTAEKYDLMVREGVETLVYCPDPFGR